MFNDKMMNDHFRDGFIFFGVALAVSSNLDKPTGWLLEAMKISSLIIAIAGLFLGVIYNILGYQKLNKRLPYNKLKMKK